MKNDVKKRNGRKAARQKFPPGWDEELMAPPWTSVLVG